MEIVKKIYNFVKNNVILVLGAIIGLLTFILSLKNKQIGALKTKEALEATKDKDHDLSVQQEADKAKIAANNNSLDNLKQKEVQLAKEQAEKEAKAKDKTPEEVVNYWNTPKN
jgi:uncharacterized membrane protein (DUF106 family)